MSACPIRFRSRCDCLGGPYRVAIEYPDCKRAPSMEHGAKSGATPKSSGSRAPSGALLIHLERLSATFTPDRVSLVPPRLLDEDRAATRDHQCKATPDICIISLAPSNGSSKSKVLLLLIN